MGAAFEMMGSIYEWGKIPERQGAVRREARAQSAVYELARMDALERGKKDAGKARMQGGQLVAQQKVAYSNSGVDASVGTPAEVMADTRMLSELEAQTIKNNAAREAWGFEKAADKTRRQGEADVKALENRKTQTLLNAGGSGANIMTSMFGGG